MNNFKISLTILLLLIGLHGVESQTTSVLTLAEASGGCGGVSNCATNTICFDVMITPDTTGVITSYNIWIQYPPGAQLVYLSNEACLTETGPVNNYDAIGYFRFSGVQGTMGVVEEVPMKLHNLCFTYVHLDSIDNELIFIGGTVFGVNSILTYSSPLLSEPQMPAYPFTLDSSTISCILLPVNWLDFQVYNRRGKSELIWTTSEEINNMGFEVQRSLDGINYTKIGWESAKTQSAFVNVYQFMDNNPKLGTNYYRLKQFDVDGHFDYSPIRWTIFGETQFDVVVRPNPAKEFLNIEIRTQEAFSTISLIDEIGRVVLTEKVESDVFKKRLSINHLSPGTYTLIVDSGTSKFLERIVIQQ